MSNVILMDTFAVTLVVGKEERMCWIYNNIRKDAYHFVKVVTVNREGTTILFVL